VKLEIEFGNPGCIYADATWKLEGNKLTETIPMRTMREVRAQHESFMFTLNPGDNIRLDGEIYHITKHEVALETLPSGEVTHFIYEIKKGRYKLPKWIKIGEVQT
jgi:hypothetical protein